jgi:hypothetical protein
MVRKTVSKYRNDERILCWNIYNEPANTLPDNVATKILGKLFEVVREEDPIQPLTADVWRAMGDGHIQSQSEKLAFELSDVISFHSYQPYDKLVAQISYLKQANRPLFLTEWLHRINHNNVQEIYPLLYITNVSNYCWGFVVGKTQTNEPWNFLWNEYENGARTDYDFTKWQHDLFRSNLRPYDPREIDIIKKFNGLAEKELIVD